MLVKQRLNMKGLIAALVATAAVLVVGVNVMAQTEDTNENVANTMRVAPVRSDITMDPGTEKKVEVTVTNPADFDVTVRPVQNDFIAGGEDGTPALILEEDEYAPNHSLKRFMQPLDNIEIPAGESKTVEVVIRVPANAEAGGYFGALRFAPVAGNDGGQVNLSASVASLILMRVNGDVPERLDMTNFDIYKAGATGAFFTDSKDLSAMVRFKNEGGVQLAPWGKLSVTRGEEVVYDADFNNKDQRDMVLPDSARRWTIPIGDVGGFGHYTVNATFTYGSSNQTIDVSKSFWIVPWAVIIGSVVGLLILVGAIIWFIRNRRQRASAMALGQRR